MDRRTANSLHVSPYMRSRQVLTAETLSDAISGCDTWVKAKILPGQLSLA
jgi:ATP-dependent helicase IRC3